MTTRTRRTGRRTAFLTAVAAAVTAGAAVAVTMLSGAASAQSADGDPRLLLLRHLPPHPSSPWAGSKIATGLPEIEPFCYGDALPGGESTRHRQFWTDVDASAQQVTVVSEDEAAARELQARLIEEISRCASDAMAENPEMTARWADYGTLPVEDGLHLFGVQTNPGWVTDISLFGVGRDGDAVTVVDWGQIGDFGSVPLSEFKSTTTSAVNRLY